MIYHILVYGCWIGMLDNLVKVSKGSGSKHIVRKKNDFNILLEKYIY